MTKRIKLENVDMSAAPWCFYGWGVEGQEDLDADAHDAIESHLDMHDGKTGIDDDDDILEIFAHERDVVTVKNRKDFAGEVLDRLSELLDDKFGSPEVDLPDPGCLDIEAAQRFVNAVVSRYQVWRCEPAPVPVVEVDVAAWIAANRPDWLSERASA